MAGKAETVRREGRMIMVRDPYGGVINVHTSVTGKDIMFTKPSGKPGTLQVLGVISKQEARELASHILSISEEFES